MPTFPYTRIGYHIFFHFFISFDIYCYYRWLIYPTRLPYVHLWYYICFGRIFSLLRFRFLLLHLLWMPLLILGVHIRSIAQSNWQFINQISEWTMRASLAIQIISSPFSVAFFMCAKRKIRKQRDSHSMRMAIDQLSLMKLFVMKTARKSKQNKKI